MENIEFREAVNYEPKTDFAHRFLEGRLIESTLVHEGDKIRIYRVFEQEVGVEGLENIRFTLDFCEPIDKEDGRISQLRFAYIGSDEDTGSDKSVAEMHFDVLESNHLDLVHRYVKPELRGVKGLGTKLLETSEQWLQSISELSKHSVEVDLETGQQNVIKWGIARGYRIDENDIDLYQEIKHHPERFVEDEVNLSQESQDNKVVKDPYTFRVNTAGRYMEDAIRIKLSKSIDSSE